MLGNGTGPVTLFPPYHDGKYIKVVETSAIVVGFAGTLLNGMLFWVISRNTGVDRKCCVIYKNLAAIDCFNCLVIPLIYFSIDTKSYALNQYNIKNGILYLLFGATVNIPYILLIMLGVARILIFQHRNFYSNRIKTGYVSIACTMIWVIGIGAPVGLWLLYLAVTTETDIRNHAQILRNFLQFQAVLLVLMIMVTSLIIFCTIVKMRGFWYTLTKHSPQLRCLVSEIKSAVLTFTLFFLSVFVWSAFPLVFAAMFAICGPEYTRFSPGFCKTFHYEFFLDPKSSYALTSLSLCCMSITNCGILLSQKSFVRTIKAMWWSMCEQVYRPEAKPEEKWLLLSPTRQENQSVAGSNAVGGFGTALQLGSEDEMLSN